MECMECGNTRKDSEGVTLPSGLGICNFCIGAAKAKAYTEWRAKNKPWRVWWASLWGVLVLLLLLVHQNWFPTENVLFLKIAGTMLVIEIAGFLYMNYKKIDVYEAR